MRNENTVDRSVRRNRNAIDQGVNRVPEKLEAGNERDVELARGKFFAERARVIEHNFTGPAMDERPRVEILNATDP